MERISKKEMNKLLEENKEKVQEIINAGGKVTDITIYKKDRITIIKKIKPVNQKAFGIKVTQTKSEITSEII